MSITVFSMVEGDEGNNSTRWFDYVAHHLEKNWYFYKLSSNLPRCAELPEKPWYLLRKAEWMRALREGSYSAALSTVREARELAPEDYSVWHAWAVMNYEQLQMKELAARLSCLPPRQRT
jgi:hypothetical protein